jgi:phage-related protein
MATMSEMIVNIGADVSDFSSEVSQMQRDFQRATEGIRRQSEQISNSFNDTGREISSSTSRASRATADLSDTMQQFNARGARSLESLQDEIQNTERAIESFASATSDADSETAKAYRETEDRLRMLRSEYAQLRSNTRKYGAETANSMREAMRPMQELRIQSRDLQSQWMQMGFNRQQFQGDTDAMMSSIEELGKAQKKLNDQMMAANEQGVVGIMQQAGAMMNMSTQASKISSAFKEQGTVLENLSQPALKAADSLNQMANKGSAAVIALKQLGPNANFKQLQDRIMMINQGIMRMNMVALVAAAGTAILFAGLHSAAMENAEYAETVEKLGATWREVFQPMVDVFIAAMVPLMKFLTKVGEMIIAFNEAHPVLAKIIQGFLMLIPLLTLILSPLAIGIGMFAGLQAALNAVWMIAGPLVTGLAAVSGPVLAIAAAIAVAVAAIWLIWKNFDTIKDYFKNLWEGVKNVTAKVWNSIKDFFAQYWDELLMLITGPIGILVGLIIKNWDTIKQKTSEIWSSITQFLSGVWQSIVQIATTVWNAVAGFFKDIWNSIMSFLTDVWNSIKSIAKSIWDPIWDYFDEIVYALLELFSVVWQAIVIVLTNVWNSIKNTAMTVWNAIKDFFTAWLEQVKENFTAIWTAISSALSAVWQAISAVATPIWESLRDFFLQWLNVIKEKFTEIWNQIKQTLTTVFNAMKQVITTVWNAVKQVTLTIWNAISSAISSVVNAIGNVISAGFNAARNVISNIMNSIKTTIVNIWNTIVSTIQGWVGKMRTVGSDMIKGLWNGIKDMGSWIKNKILGFLEGITDNIKDFFGIASPSKLFKEFGGFLGEGLAIGIDGTQRLVSDSAMGMADTASQNGQPQYQPLQFDSSDLVASQRSASSESNAGVSVSIAQMVVRNEDDIYKLSQDLNRRISQSKRSRGY